MVPAAGRTARRRTAAADIVVDTSVDTAAGTDAVVAAGYQAAAGSTGPDKTDTAWEARTQAAPSVGRPPEQQDSARPFGNVRRGSSCHCHPQGQLPVPPEALRRREAAALPTSSAFGASQSVSQWTATTTTLVSVPAGRLPKHPSTSESLKKHRSYNMCELGLTLRSSY